MRFRHTPGFWFAQHRYVVTANAGRVDRHGYDDLYIIARVDGRTPREAKANAILIADLPVLLDALRKSTRAMRAYLSRIEPGTDPDTENAYRRNLEALAHATGRKVNR